MRRLLSSLIAITGCGSLFDGSRAEPTFVAPTTTQRYVNAASPEDKLGYQSGACDAYRLQWDPGTSVRLSLEAEGYATWMEVQRPGAPKRRVDGRAGAPAVVELVRRAAPGAWHILVAGASHDADGEYLLTVGPPPQRELALPPPPVPMAERVAALLARTPPDAAYALGKKDREIALEAATERCVPHGAPMTRRLEAFEPVSVPAETGYCYQILWRLRGLRPVRASVVSDGGLRLRGRV